MAAAKAITVWLLGKDQSPATGQLSRVTLPGSCRQGRFSAIRLLRTEFAAYATTTISGEASTRAITADSAPRARHQPHSMRTAKRARPRSDQTVITRSSQCGAASAQPITRV
ncbi:hypothetical protein GCM10025734_60110 [Kitasatospora paranensis]